VRGRIHYDDRSINLLAANPVDHTDEVYSLAKSHVSGPRIEDGSLIVDENWRSACSWPSSRIDKKLLSSLEINVDWTCRAAAVE